MIDSAGDDTKIDVKVTAEDGFTSETYTINVVKVEDASITATLSSLSVTAGGSDLTLMPPFMPDAEPEDGGHAVDVSAATSSVVVNATISHTGATVKTSSGTQTGDGVNDRSFTLKAAGMATEINGQGNGAGQGDDPCLYDHCHKSIEHRLQGHHAAYSDADDG